ncbi:MAG: N-acyl homoserine lactonase family protein, partial [Thermodesulfobacteriota bacterium]
MSIPSYEIVALRMGELEVDKSTITYGVDFGKVIKVPIWAVLIRGGGQRILVAKGNHIRQWVHENVAPTTQTEDEKIEKAIEKAAGWTLDEVDIVVNTHLHYDHCGGNPLFKNARLYVQQSEWNHAHDPIESQRWIYSDTSFLFDRPNVDFFAWYFLDGDSEILPGIKVIHTPGHTPGGQTVLVKTEEGTVAITGDAANIMENIKERRPVGILSDMDRWFKSLDRIKAYADMAICGHDPSIASFQNG